MDRGLGAPGKLPDSDVDFLLGIIVAADVNKLFSGR